MQTHAPEEREKLISFQCIESVPLEANNLLSRSWDISLEQSLRQGSYLSKQLGNRSEGDFLEKTKKSKIEKNFVLKSGTFQR